jgi:hypothetical protein
MLNKLIYEAAKDLRFLLSRNYNRTSAIKFIGDKYLLDKLNRHILFRAIYPKETIEEISKKIIEVKKIEGHEIAIDGFNLLITTEAIIKGSTIILCDDGLVRDISATFEKFKATDVTFNALNMIFELLSKYPPRQTYFFLDRPISNSGKLAENVNNFFKKFNLPGIALTSRNVDKEVAEKEIAATSDNIIIYNINKVVDIPSNFLDIYKGELISFKE